MTQGEMIQNAAEQGFISVEVRGDFPIDFEEIAAVSDATGVEIYYSDPTPIFKNGQVNPDLVQHLRDAKKMNAKKIKWIIGDFDKYEGSLADDLIPLLDFGIEINVENDQSQQNGRITPNVRFMEAVTQAGIDIGYVFDVGNFAFVGCDVMVASRKLAPYTRYIHLKDVYIVDGEPMTEYLGKGSLPIQQVLAQLPKDAPFGIEYPINDDKELKNAEDYIKGV